MMSQVEIAAICLFCFMLGIIVYGLCLTWIYNNPLWMIIINTSLITLLSIMSILIACGISLHVCILSFICGFLVMKLIHDTIYIRKKEGTI